MGQVPAKSDDQMLLEKQAVIDARKRELSIEPPTVTSLHPHRRSAAKADRREDDDVARSRDAGQGHRQSPEDPAGAAISSDEGPKTDAAPNADSRFTLVPEGDYTVSFTGATRRKRYGRRVWDCEFKILEGAHAGRTLCRYLTIPEGTSSRSSMHKDFVQVVGLRPPSSLKNMNPKEFYAKCALVVKVETIIKNEDGDMIPPGAHTSVIRRVRSVSAGSPPYQQRREQQ